MIYTPLAAAWTLAVWNFALYKTEICKFLKRTT